MEEIFKDIQGYEGLYQVSNLGNVKSLPKGDGNGNRERLLKQEVISKNHTSYRRVTLSKEGKTKRFQVHRLVAQVFLPNPSNLPFVNHVDNNGSNNTLSNLEWCTHEHNMQHSANQGRQDESRYLGGVAAGAIKKTLSEISATKQIGQVYGKLTITAFYFDTALKRPRIKFMCKCSCGNVTEKVMYNLLNRKQMCIECSLKSR